MDANFLFNPDFYLHVYRDVAESKMDPYQHYDRHGSMEGRLPLPCSSRNLYTLLSSHTGKDLQEYLNKLEKDDPDLFQYYKLRIEKGKKDFELISNSDFFDIEYYSLRNPEINRLGIPPLVHYMLWGDREQRACGPLAATMWEGIGPTKLGRNTLAYERYGKHVKQTQLDSQDIRSLQESADKVRFDLHTLREIISNEDIKVVSFDVFDTLLARPTTDHKDIFKLMERVLANDGIKNVFKMRNWYDNLNFDLLANLDEIYEYIQKQFKIPASEINKMKDVELSLEKNLLFRREEVYQIYLLAKKLGKKVIAVSDMYLPSSVIEDILQKNGYTEIDKVYVSNEQYLLKSSGLFNKVIDRENIDPGTMVHIGDNIVSDYYYPQKSGITAFYYPKAKDIVLGGTSIGKSYREPADLWSRIILGFTFNKIAGDFYGADHTDTYFNNFNELVKLGIFPLLVSITLYIANSRSIQKSYSQILFASRDGYLPMQVYNVLAQYIENLAPSKYVYAGRRAYAILLSDTPYDYIYDFYQWRNMAAQEANLKVALSLAFPIDRLGERISEKIGHAEDIQLRPGGSWIMRLKPYEEELVNAFEKMRAEALQFYRYISDPGQSREIIFDCGYSGSVSTYLSAALDKKVDKIYLWEDEVNIQKDKLKDTKTFTLFSGKKSSLNGIEVACEELFSPLEGGCIGFIDGKPMFEEEDFSDSLLHMFGQRDQIVTDLAHSFFSKLAPYLKFCEINNPVALTYILRNSLVDRLHNTLNILSDIKFHDPISNPQLPYLDDKLSEYLKYPDVFAATAINENNEVGLSDVMPEVTNPPLLGLHVHAHNHHLMGEIICYLARFPFLFDLYITYDNQDVARPIERFVSLLPNLNAYEMIFSENRGRDVAPWVIGMRPFQKNYEIFGHFHAKQSGYADYGTKWRRYLFDNVLDCKSVKNIISYMLLNEDVGCVFPRPFPEVRKIHKDINFPQFGGTVEHAMIKDLLKRMGIMEYPTRSKLIYSVGTMLWYRPKALRQLFEVDIDISEFLREPIGLGGTLTHALERIPCFVASHNGFRTSMLTTFPMA